MLRLVRMCFLVKLEYVTCLVLALLQVFLTFRLRDGDFFNSYVFISDDGFDWILQGVAFNQFISGADESSWYYLRNPGFVLINALDAALHASGLIVLGTMAIAVFATLVALAWIARKLGYGVAETVVALFAVYFSGLGYWRLWVLSDTLCVALMTWGLCLLIQEGVDNSQPHLLAATACATAAGLTQIYGVIPFCVTGGLMFVFRVLRQERFDKSLALSIAVAPVLTFVGLQLWAGLIPHQSRPLQFELFKLALAMTKFYLNVWGFEFGAFLPIVVVAAVFRIQRRISVRDYELGLLGAFSTLSLLTFFYQWRESRFAFASLTVFTLLLLALCRPRRLSKAHEDAHVRIGFLYSCALSVLVGVVVVPDNYAIPVIRGARLDWRNSWMAAALQAKPQDRFGLAQHCPTTENVCRSAVVPELLTPYRVYTFNEYRRRVVRDAR